MLFGIVYKERHSTEEMQQRSLQLFTNWQPPVEFKGHWAFTTGGGMAIVESDDAAAIFEAVSAFTPYLEFRVEPVLEIEAAVPIFMKTNEWRGSVT